MKFVEVVGGILIVVGFGLELEVCYVKMIYVYVIGLVGVVFVVIVGGLEGLIDCGVGNILLVEVFVVVVGEGIEVGC